jgi:hypothetical protein
VKTFERKLDGGIKHEVQILRANGVESFESRQGGQGHGHFKSGGIVVVTDKEHQRTMRRLSKFIKANEIDLRQQRQQPAALITKQSTQVRNSR